jgi:hypothetical protein
VSTKTPHARRVARPTIGTSRGHPLFRRSGAHALDPGRRVGHERGHGEQHATASGCKTAKPSASPPPFPNLTALRHTAPVMGNRARRERVPSGSVCMHASCAGSGAASWWQPPAEHGQPMGGRGRGAASMALIAYFPERPLVSYHWWTRRARHVASAALATHLMPAAQRIGMPVESPHVASVNHIRGCGRFLLRSNPLPKLRRGMNLPRVARAAFC